MNNKRVSQDSVGEKENMTVQRDMAYRAKDNLTMISVPQNDMQARE